MYTVDHPDLTVSNFMEKSNGQQRIILDQKEELSAQKYRFSSLREHNSKKITLFSGQIRVGFS